MNILLGIDQHVERELADAKDEASRLMEQTVAAYQRVTELELARDLRVSLGAKVALSVTEPGVMPIRKEATAP